MPVDITGTRIFIDRSVDPPIGISWDNIGSVLVTASRDEGTLCSHPDINKWAKFRPVDLPVKFGLGPNGVLTEDQRRMVTWGWDTVSTETPAYLVDHYVGDQTSERMNGWRAQFPKGGIEVSPYRANDFDGYSHKAMPPIVKCSVGTSAMTNVVGSGITLAVIPAFVDDSAPGLTLQDIADALQVVDGLYLGFVMFKGEISTSAQADNAIFAIATAAQPISVTEDGYSGLSVTISTYNTATHPWSGYFGQYTCVPFLSTVRIAQKESWTQGGFSFGRFYTCPLLGAWDCQVRNSGSGGGGGTVSQYFRGIKQGSVAVKWELSLVNTADSPITRAVGVWLLKTSSGSPATHVMEAGEKHIDLGNVTIAGNSSYTDQGIISLAGYPEIFASCVLWLQIGSEFYRYFILQLPEE